MSAAFDTHRRLDPVWPQALFAVLAALVVAAPLMLLPPPFSFLAPIALALAPFAVIFAFRNPFILCLVFIIFSFFRIHEAFPALNPLRIPSLVAIPTLAILCWHLFLTRQIKPYWSRELSLVAALFAVATVSVLFAINRQLAFSYWMATYWKIGIMTLAIAWLVRMPADFSRAAQSFVLAGCLVAVVAISNKLAGIGLVEGTRVTIARDIGSVLGDPNDLALVLLFPLSFAASLVVYRAGFLSALLGLVGVGLMVWAIICTQSRGGLLGIITVFGVIGWRQVKSKTLLISVGAVGAMVLFAAMGISDRASGGAHEEGIDESAMGRLHAWEAAWNMAMARPLTGVGLDNFVANFYLYTPHWGGMNKAVHSTWFNVLSETGFTGFFVFIAMIVVAMRSAIRSARILRVGGAPAQLQAISLALIAGIASFCVSGTFLTQGFTWPIYILLALTAATARYALQRENPQNDAGGERSRTPWRTKKPGPRKNMRQKQVA